MKTFWGNFSINIYLPYIVKLVVFPISFTLYQYQADHFYVFNSSIWWPSSPSFFFGRTTFKSISDIITDISDGKNITGNELKDMIPKSKMVYNWKHRRRKWIRNELQSRWTVTISMIKMTSGHTFSTNHRFYWAIAHSNHPNMQSKLLVSKGMPLYNCTFSRSDENDVNPYHIHSPIRVW